MASFNRADYEFAFRCAREMYFQSNGSDEENAVLLMYKIEDCIGQQEWFPSSARETYPRKFFGERLHKIEVK